MKKVLSVALTLFAVSACSSAHVEWSKPEMTAEDLSAAKTDCEFKVRQVAVTFQYDIPGLERFAFTCMRSHGYAGQWQKA